mgnify:CR=1 FL=1
MAHKLTDMWAHIQSIYGQLSGLRTIPTEEDQPLSYDSIEWTINEYLDDLTERNEKLRQKFAQHLFFNWKSQYPNLAIDDDIATAYCQDHFAPHEFRAEDLLAHLTQTYCPTMSIQTMKDIGGKAFSLVQYRERTQSPDYFLHKHILRLYCYIEPSYRYPYPLRLSHSSAEGVKALWKLAAIVLTDANPVDIVPSHSLQNMLAAENRGETIIGREWDCEPLAFRFFKNNRLDILTKSPRHAEQLAHALFEYGAPPSTT